MEKETIYFVVIWVSFLIVDIIITKIKNKSKLKAELKIAKDNLNLDRERYRLEKIRVQVLAEQNMLIELTQGIGKGTIDMDLIQLKQELRDEVENENYERCEELNKLIKIKTNK